MTALDETTANFEHERDTAWYFPVDMLVPGQYGITMHS